MGRLAALFGPFCERRVGYLSGVEEPGSFSAGNDFERHGTDMCAFPGVCMGHTFASNSIVRFLGIIPRKCKEEKIEAGDSGWRWGDLGFVLMGAWEPVASALRGKRTNNWTYCAVGAIPGLGSETWGVDFWHAAP